MIYSAINCFSILMYEYIDIFIQNNIMINDNKFELYNAW